MAPVFDKVITEIINTCNADDEIKVDDKEGEEGGKSTSAGTGFSLDSDSDKDAEEVDIAVDVNHLDEKSSAVNALGVIGQHSPKLCQGKGAEILKTLTEMQFYFHPNVRLQVIYAYLQLCHGSFKLAGVLDADEEFKWTKGLPENSPLPPASAAFIGGTVIPYYFDILDQEEDKEVIESVLERLRECLERYGPAAIAQHLDKLVAILIKYLDKKAFCQTKILEGEDANDLEDVDDDDDDDEEEEEGDDGIDHDEIILGNVSDVIIAIARAYGNEFAGHFN